MHTIDDYPADPYSDLMARATLGRLLHFGPTPQFLDQVYNDQVIREIAKTYDYEDDIVLLGDWLKDGGLEYMRQGPVGEPRKSSAEVSKLWRQVSESAHTLTTAMYGLGDEFFASLPSDLKRKKVKFGTIGSVLSDEWFEVKDERAMQLYMLRFFRVLQMRGETNSKTALSTTKPGPRPERGLEAFVSHMGLFWVGSGRKLTIDNHPGAVSPALSFFHDCIKVLHDIPPKKIVTAARRLRLDIEAHINAGKNPEDSVNGD